MVRSEKGGLSRQLILGKQKDLFASLL